MLREPAVNLEARLAQLERELAEAREQQAATADVLKVISRSTFDLPSVLETLVESAARLCHADQGNIARVDGGRLQFVAFSGFETGYRQYMKTLSLVIDRGSISGRAVIDRSIVHIDDVLVDPEFTMFDAQKRGGFRTGIGVPLLRDGMPIGVFFLTRAAIDPFTPKQIELVTSFADQAVIAIENARLFEQVQARTDELSELLEQQTATADMLNLISRSALDLQSVLETLVASAARICRADKGNIARVNGDTLQFVAFAGFELSYREYMKALSPRIDRGSISGRAVLERRIVHIHDVLADPEFTMFDAQRRGGFRTGIGLPLLRDGTPIGVFFLTRPAVDPFTPKQIELLNTFADQAVIAIENAGLFKQVQARTRELSQSLEYQTATGDILRVISSSPTDVQPVFETIAANALQLCGARWSAVIRFDGQLMELAALHNLSEPEEIAAVRQAYPRPLSRGGSTERAILSRATAYVPDVREDPEYQHVELAQAAGFRSTLSVPMLRAGQPLGAITVAGAAPRAFSQRQVDLLQTFAEQAVIAIENVRMFDDIQKHSRDLTEALDQQTATADVLQVISSSPGELEPVFNAMLENAVRICEAKFGNLFLYRDGAFRIVAMQNPPPDYAEQWRRDPVVVVSDNPGMPIARLAQAKQVMHIADVTRDAGYAGHDRRVVSPPMPPASAPCCWFPCSRTRS